jgi:hypothetical protein
MKKNLKVWNDICKVFGFAFTAGAIASAAMMFAANGTELLKGGLAMLLCLVIRILLAIAEYRMARVREHIVI